MVTVNQMQRGVTTFIDREIAPHLSGFEKVVVGGGANLIVSKLPDVMSKLNENPMISALGIYDKESGKMDIDAVYNAVKPYISAEPFSIKIPVAEVTLKMGQGEIADLYRYIKEA